MKFKPEKKLGLNRMFFTAGDLKKIEFKGVVIFLGLLHGRSCTLHSICVLKEKECIAKNRLHVFLPVTEDGCVFFIKYQVEMSIYIEKKKYVMTTSFCFTI